MDVAGPQTALLVTRGQKKKNNKKKKQETESEEKRTGNKKEKRRNHEEAYCKGQGQGGPGLGVGSPQQIRTELDLLELRDLPSPLPLCPDTSIIPEELAGPASPHKSPQLNPPKLSLGSTSTCRECLASENTSTYAWSVN